MWTMSVFDRPSTFETWDKEYYPPLARWYYDRAIPRMVASLGPELGATVLDAGCGPGVHSIRVAQMGYQVHSVDLSESVIEEARRRADRAGVSDRIVFEQADLTHLEFPDASFECVFSWGVVIHIPDVAAALSELARVTKPGGRLALQLVNKNAWDFRVLGLARTVLRRPHPKTEAGPLGHGAWYEFQGERLWVWALDVPAVVRHLEGQGLRLTKRAAGEFTELQRRMSSIPRQALLLLNNCWFALRLPAGPACTNVLTFEKGLGGAEGEARVDVER